MRCPMLPDEGCRTRVAKTAHGACRHGADAVAAGRQPGPVERRELPVAWIILVLSGTMEAVWATALSKSDGFSQPVPTIVFLVGMAASMAGLAFATKTLPIGTAYAVWVGIGAACTVIYAMATGAEVASVAKIALLVVLIGCVIGLKLVSDAEGASA